MVLSEKVKIKRDDDSKYGDSDFMVVATQTIEAGEVVSSCSCSEQDVVMSRDELLKMMDTNSSIRLLIVNYSCMNADDQYCVPPACLGRGMFDECTRFNHSCDPNCGFQNGNPDIIVSMRKIDIGEELTLHYNFIETEPSFSYGMQCKCRASNCLQVLPFDCYRSQDFQERYFHYMTPYVQERVNELRHKWYSGKCYTRSMLCSGERTLYSLVPIEKGEIVARFSGEIAPDKHFIRSINSGEVPTCTIQEYSEVVTLDDLPANTEITLAYE